MSDKLYRWVKASEIYIDYRKRYIAKRVDDESIYFTGRFQKSDGVFFWENSPGYVPMTKAQYHLLLVLVEIEAPSTLSKGEGKAALKEDGWIDVKDKIKPPYGEEVEVSFDGGKTIECTAQFSENCTCMMAGIAGGFGYFRDKFATIEDNLILSDVTHWRPLQSNPLPQPPTSLGVSAEGVKDKIQELVEATLVIGVRRGSPEKVHHEDAVALIGSSTINLTERFQELFSQYASSLLTQYKEFLKAHEQWEADFISDNSMWWPAVEKDAVRGKIYEKFLELQGKRNKLLSQQKEP